MTADTLKISSGGSESREEELNAADSEWGYPFGVDGLMKKRTACEFLDVKPDTLDRMVAHKEIRKSFNPRTNWVMFCTRSIKNHVKSLVEVPAEDCRT